MTILKVIAALILAIVFFLPIRRRGMWVPRFILLLGLALPCFFLPVLRCVLSFLMTISLWLLLLFILARPITPLPRDHPEFARSWLLLWWYLIRRMLSLHPPAYVVEGGRVEETIAGTRLREFRLGPIPAKSLPLFMRISLPNAPVLVRSDNVAILQLFVEPSRVVGNQASFRPDVNARDRRGLGGKREHGTTICFLNLYEDVKGAIDLRFQRRAASFRANTGDSMEVNPQLLLDLSLRPPGKRRDVIYTYDDYNPEDALNAFYLQGPGEPGTITWDERAFSMARAQLSKIVSRFNLGTFYGNEHRANSSEILEAELAEELGESLRPASIELMRVALKGVPLQVLDYSLRDWEASVELKEKPLEAGAEAAYWRQVCEARVAFLQELMGKISDALRGASRSTLEITLAMRLANIVEELACSLASRGLLSPETARTLEEIGMFKALSPGKS